MSDRAKITELQRLCNFVHVDVSRGSSPDLRYVEVGSIQHDPELAPEERNLAH